MTKQKKKKRFRKLVSILSLTGFLACTVALMYPFISDRWNRYRDSKLITEYNSVITDTDAEESLMQHTTPMITMNHFLIRSETA